LNLGTIKELLEAEILTEHVDLQREVTLIKASDLMSDVLTRCPSGAVLITGLTNNQSVRTAEVVDLCAIVFVRGKRPSDETIQLAQDSGIHLMATELPMFEACGVLYASGASAGSE
jgi:hypothetical protein